ncbi:MAG: NACHT domain-containing protein [Acidobacteria bacterium]|nr:NACHT domain-containing protein [Acidobacteriota bacterium]
MSEERDLLEQITLLEAYLLSGPNCLLIVATSDNDIEKGISEEIKLRIEREVSVNTFTYSSNSIDELSLSQQLSNLPKPSRRSVLFVFGLDDLPKDSRNIAINALNWGRETLKWAGYSVVLWVRLGTPPELGNRAPDFFSWRSDVFEFDLAKNEKDHKQIFAQLRLLATLDSDLDELRKNYCNYVIQQQDKIGFQGFVTGIDTRFSLEQVFVPLTLSNVYKPHFPSLLESSPLPTIENLRTLYVQELKEEINLKDALKHKKIVLLGKSGSGKTTILSYLAVSLAKDILNKQNTLDLEVPLLPIIVWLPILKDELQTYQTSNVVELENLLVLYFVKQNLQNLSKLFANVFEKQRAMILLDGFDEITYKEQIILTGLISNFIKKYPLTYLIVTGHRFAFNKKVFLEEFAILKINPLNSFTIKQFVQKWSFAYESINSVPSRMEEQTKLRANSLLVALNLPKLLSLAYSPMMLTLLVLFRSRIARLPIYSSIKLYYQDYVRVIIKAFIIDSEKSISTFSLQQIKYLKNETFLFEIFAYVAFLVQIERKRFFTYNKLEISIKDFLMDYEGLQNNEAEILAQGLAKIVTKHIKLINRSLNLFYFVHTNIQKYLVSYYLTTVLSKRGQNFITYYQQLRDSIYLPQWQEIIVFTVTSLSKEEAQDLIKQILNAHNNFDSFFENLAELKQSELDSEKRKNICYSIANLLLAGYCVKEEEINASLGLVVLKRKIQEALVKLWYEIPNIPFSLLETPESYITHEYIIGSLHELLIESEAFDLIENKS